MLCHKLDEDRYMYCVYGLGMVFCHEQRWQAEWKLEYMCNATACTKCVERKLVGQDGST